MLILQRRAGQSLLIGEDIEVTVISVEGNRVRLAISAPADVSILRNELMQAQAVNLDAAREEADPAELLGVLGESLVHPVEGAYAVQPFIPRRSLNGEEKAD